MINLLVEETKERAWRDMIICVESINAVRLPVSNDNPCPKGLRWVLFRRLGV
jgi:hypothetical protein